MTERVRVHIMQKFALIATNYIKSVMECKTIRVHCNELFGIKAINIKIYYLIKK